MSSFGEKLKHEREARNATIEEIALATGIQLGYLEALENNDFHALPGQAFGKLYIRAYAEVLEFDPQSLIDDYDREQVRKRPASTERRRPEPDHPRPVKAAIARWREAKIHERSKPARGVAPDEAERGEPGELQQPDSVEAPQTDPVEVAQNEIVQIEHTVAAEPVEPVVSDSQSSAPIPRTASWTNRLRFVALLFFGLFLGAAVVYLTFFFRTGEDRSRPPSTLESGSANPDQDRPPAESPRAQNPVEAAEASTARAETKPIAGATAAQLHLTVPEFGVGRRIVKRRLEGQDERFAEGEVAWFSTRVLGGARGEPIRHVWLHEGRILQSIQLRLGGPDWHTHSSKRLGELGHWAVEARDKEGRVLARATFACLPAGG